MNTDLLFNKGYKLEFFHVPSGQSVSFKAFITTFSDSWSQTWEGEKTIGRYDPFQNYQNTERVISLGWDIVAESGQEARMNLRKISQLAKMSYPVYDVDLTAKQNYLNSNVTNSTAIVESPMIKVKLVNLIQSTKAVFNQGLQHSGFASAEQAGLPCTTDGFTITYNLEDGFLEETAEFSQDTGVQGRASELYPKSVSVSCTLKILHDHTLGWEMTKNFRNTNYPYGLTSGDDNNEIGDYADLLGIQEEDATELLATNFDEEMNSDEIISAAVNSILGVDGQDFNFNPFGEED